jgi:hypothetical protein
MQMRNKGCYFGGIVEKLSKIRSGQVRSNQNNSDLHFWKRYLSNEQGTIKTKITKYTDIINRRTEKSSAK